MEQSKSYSMDWGGRNLLVTLNNWADQAHGSVLVQYGETVVFGTATMGKSPREDVNFFPLLVDYQEKFYASGKIKGSRFVKREGRPSDEATLTGRMVDRAIRPRFDMRTRNDVQVVLTALSFDKKNDPDLPALLAGSLSLSVSPIPWNGPIGIVKVGKIDGEFVLNPIIEEEERSDYLITVAGTKDRINMIEAGAKEVLEEEILTALEFAKKYIQKIVEFQEKIADENKVVKSEAQLFSVSEALAKEVDEFLKGDRLETALFQEAKKDRVDAVGKLKEELKASLEERYKETDQSAILLGLDHFEEKVNEIVHANIIEKGRRVDGRKLDELRDIDCRAGVLPRTHGSSLFMRGNTHALVTVTLGAPGMEQIIDEMKGEEKKRFMLHYNFPSFSVGEVMPMRGPGRREIGHGALAEKALGTLVPTKDEFPYAIRLVSEILSSNGSSSMASVCGGAMAMMDAGVPLRKSVAGIAMGLMTGKNGEYKVLTDIQGPEDHHGDMDFKVAGTDTGVTAIQMDVKIEGVTLTMLKDTFEQAKKARHEILGYMKKAIAEPRESLSPYAPRIMVIQINPDKIRDVIGPGGKVINEIIDETGVLSIDIEDDGKVYVAAESGSEEAANKAVAWIKSITREVRVGEVFMGKVTKVADFGAFVEITPKQDGLVHVSELSSTYVKNAGDTVKVGDLLRVKVIRIDEQGKVALSVKAAKLTASSGRRE
ncbi:MAG: polyribonucleotide nucleotidyltransferase [Candidatus Spechtbacteria bacterium]|nr:polyribonucleotide nucleotidyltransferase [Candidatus Spechtbacteria bacterium]